MQLPEAERYKGVGLGMAALLVYQQRSGCSKAVDGLLKGLQASRQP